ncbi:zinc-ribbon domain-containing protein [Methanobrevibacter sp.]|uniref:zinc ribbon domain-containing protein n=1 Tax=Methanobrevibacter sp. TaxID=66852 RepID=UPI0038664187
MANFCTNCGNRLGKDDTFCTNCGTKVDIKQDNPSLKSMPDSMEKEMAKRELKRIVGGSVFYNKTFRNALSHNGLDIFRTGKAIKQQVEKEIESGQIKSGGVEFRVNQLIVEYKTKMEKEKEEKRKKSRMIDEIFESEEIKSEMIRKDIRLEISIKNKLKDKIINKKENMSEDEIRYFIRSELEKAKDKQEMASLQRNYRLVNREMHRRKMEENESGRYCDFGCRYFYEEFLDENGGVVGDFDSGGAGVDYYCKLGYSVGGFCEYYEE